MKAFEITEKTIELLRSGKYKFGRLNFPNGDMVGHTGVVDAIIESVEAVDVCVAKLIKVVCELNGIAVILADHGNADEMFVVEDGKRITKTSHSLNPVPFIIVDSGYEHEYTMAKFNKRGLSNVAATILNLLGFEKVKEYDPSLVIFTDFFLSNMKFGKSPEKNPRRKEKVVLPPLSSKNLSEEAGTVPTSSIKCFKGKSGLPSSMKITKEKASK